MEFSILYRMSFRPKRRKALRSGEILLACLLATVFCILFCSAIFASAPRNNIAADTNEADRVLLSLNKHVKALETLSAKISYAHSQPLFETESIHAGNLYYLADNNKPRLRINFNNLIQDGQEQKNYREDYFFDGIWLSRIDYQAKTVTKQQVAEPNKSIPPFELVSRYFPIVGFAEPNDLQKVFKLQFFGADKIDGPVRFHLIPKENTPFSKDYKSIDFIISAKIFLPTEFNAETVSGEIIKIVFSDIRENKKLSSSIFKQDFPSDFARTVNSLK